MTSTTPQRPKAPPKERKNPVLLGGLLIILVLPLALPRNSISLYWQVLGIVLLGMGAFYAFVFKNAVVTVSLAATFAGMFEAPLKYLTDNKIIGILGYLGRDFIIYTLVLSFLLDFFAKLRPEIPEGKAPPAMFWIVCFLLNILVQIFNPEAYTALASFLNSRIFWEMIPLYFIGYYYLRSMKDWKIIFVLFCLLTLVNGIVAIYQSSVGPDQIAAWGPGYKTQIFDRGRTVTTSEGEITFRPFGLGPDLGFSGFLGLVTIPMLTALLVAQGQQPEQPKILSLFGRLVGISLVGVLVAGTFGAIIVSGSRSVVILGVVFGTVSLLFFSWKASKIQLAIGISISISLALVVLSFLKVVAPNFAERYTQVSSAENAIETFNEENRWAQISTIPIDIAVRHPFGAGLDNLGPGASFSNTLVGTPTRPQIENSENNITLSLIGMGVPGLLIWLFIHLRLIYLSWNAIQSVRDQEAKTIMGGGFILYVLMLIFWPFGGFITFPLNMVFWLIPGMILGTADEYRKKRFA
jgi:hypothetical protein